MPATDNPRAIMIQDDTSKTGMSPLVVRSQVCVATPAWSQFQGMSDWCQLNCLRYPPHCPSHMCTCLTTCRAVTNDNNLTDFECSKRCLRYPHSGQCPAQCRCSANPGQDSSNLDAVIIDARGHSQVRAQTTNSKPIFYNLITPLSPVQWQILPSTYSNLGYF